MPTIVTLYSFWALFPSLHLSSVVNRTVNVLLFLPYDFEYNFIQLEMPIHLLMPDLPPLEQYMAINDNKCEKYWLNFYQINIYLTCTIFKALDCVPQWTLIMDPCQGYFKAITKVDPFNGVTVEEQEVVITWKIRQKHYLNFNWSNKASLRSSMRQTLTRRKDLEAGCNGGKAF